MSCCTARLNILQVSNWNTVLCSTSTYPKILLFRNSDQQTSCSGLQEPEPVQALQAGTQTGRLWQCECLLDSESSSCSCTMVTLVSSDVNWLWMCLCVHLWADWKWLRLEAGLPGPRNPRSQLSRRLQCQMCLPQVRTMLPPQLLQAFVLQSCVLPDVFHTILQSRYPHIVLLSLQDHRWASPGVMERVFLWQRLIFFSRYLYGFEEYCTSTAITFRMDLPLKQGPKGEVKPEVEAGGTAATSASSVEQTGPKDGEPCGAQSAVCKVHFP